MIIILLDVSQVSAVQSPLGKIAYLPGMKVRLEDVFGYLFVDRYRVMPGFKVVI